MLGSTSSASEWPSTAMLKATPSLDPRIVHFSTIHDHLSDAARLPPHPAHVKFNNPQLIHLGEPDGGDSRWQYVIRGCCVETLRNSVASRGESGGRMMNWRPLELASDAVSGSPSPDCFGDMLCAWDERQRETRVAEGAYWCWCCELWDEPPPPPSRGVRVIIITVCT